MAIYIVYVPHFKVGKIEEKTHWYIQNGDSVSIYFQKKHQNEVIFGLKLPHFREQLFHLFPFLAFGYIEK